jgi:hypothetical protein
VSGFLINPNNRNEYAAIPYVQLGLSIRSSVSPPPSLGLGRSVSRRKQILFQIFDPVCLESSSMSRFYTERARF